MYIKFIKPLLFKLNIEQALNIIVWSLRIIGHIPGAKKLLRMNYQVESRSLEREVFGVKFRNPMGLAPGFDINADIIDEVEALGFGFVEVGAITPQPQIGNPKPRLFSLEEDHALINRMGQPNKGLKYAINNLRKRSKEIIVGCNIARNSYTPANEVAKEYLKVFRSLYQYADYFTVSVISSNSATEGAVFDETELRKIITPLFDFRRGQSDYRPIFVKVSPDLSDEQIDSVTDIMIDTPLDGVVAISGTLKRENLKSNNTVVTRIGAGRMGGDAIRERALEVVRRIHKRSNGAYPIIGVGGIDSPEDAKEMLEAGASLIQIYSGFLYEGPQLIKQICKSLATGEVK
ncbi:MAG: quinone-dependent dihydroorotate dehydrogenase [Rikenellaceae bacterium]